MTKEYDKGGRQRRRTTKEATKEDNEGGQRRRTINLCSYGRGYTDTSSHSFIVYRVITNDCKVFDVDLHRAPIDGTATVFLKWGGRRCITLRKYSEAAQLRPTKRYAISP